MKMTASICIENEQKSISKELIQQLDYERKIKYFKKNNSKDHEIETLETLAQNYNEMVQIKQFI